MYKVASSSEYLVITGIGIQDTKIAKKAWILPGQLCTVFDVSPVNYSFEVQAMSVQKLAFVLPAVFTIGPQIDDHESLIKYAKLISPHGNLSKHVNDLVLGIIEGETRVIAASMTMEDIFCSTKDFKDEVFRKVQPELNQFGLWIYNANVKQLVDVPGHEYFSYLGQKVHEEAANKAKVEVAEARMKGAIGTKLREGLTQQNAAKIDAETRIVSTQRKGEGEKEVIKVKAMIKVFKNQRESEVAEANSDLAKKKANWGREAQLAEMEAVKAVAVRDAELQREVEMMNALTMTEKLKGEFLSKAKVEYETKVKKANWELYAKQKEAEAALYAKQREADAQRQSAEADLYAKKKEAEGLMVLTHAEGAYLRTLVDAVGDNNYNAVRDYLMISNDMLVNMARINSRAVESLEPNISIWTGVGSHASGKGGGG
ncbi:flotillin-like protein 1 [Impatiens glandulifera]|uniref:flotillin-like protein 1 n=1 Tax=Impatiens glandulifera TaxID=253017 RepID=UPI001FB04F26|nr:flotillin-like protein 1 [Impatiens glandulifera]